MFFPFEPRLVGLRAAIASDPSQNAYRSRASRYCTVSPHLFSARCLGHTMIFYFYFFRTTPHRRYFESTIIIFPQPNTVYMAWIQKRKNEKNLHYSNRCLDPTMHPRRKIARLAQATQVKHRQSVAVPR